MKAFTLFFVFFLFLVKTDVQAQFTQFHHSADTGTYVWDITTCNDGHFCTVSSSGFRKYDPFGNLVWERRYNTLPLFNTYGPSISNIDMCRLVHTEDDGIIYFSFRTDVIGTFPFQITLYPIAVKLDQNGDLEWAKKYGYSYHPGTFLPMTNLLKVDARRMNSSTPDDQRYIFALHGSPAEGLDSPYNYGQNINILSIDGNGDVIWNKKYTQRGATNYTTWDIPQTISYAGNDNVYGDVYYVSGQRVQSDRTGNESAMFRMLIDENGNIVHPYQVVKHHSEYNFSGHAIYDADKDAILHSFTLMNTDITDGPENTVVAIQELDRSFTTNWYRIYWAPNSDHNYGYRIEKSKVAPDEYVVSGLLND